MDMKQRRLYWIFDVVSPFAYLGLQQLKTIPEHVSVEFVPVLFAALLNHHGQIGNAEIASKRRFTYRFALWRASKLGIAMRFPPSHPFNPLAALRLIIAAGNDYRAVKLVFDAVFLHGRDVSNPQVIGELAAQLGVSDPETALRSPAVKQKLQDNSNWAISLGAFGVPTIVIDDELFWGQDSFEMALDYLRHPEQFQRPEMLAIEDIPVGASRQRAQPAVS